MLAVVSYYVGGACCACIVALYRELFIIKIQWVYLLFAVCNVVVVCIILRCVPPRSLVQMWLSLCDDCNTVYLNIFRL